MGELVAGKPALQLNFLVSLPLDLVSLMSLLHRAVPGSGLATWLVKTRRALSPSVRADLDLLHGFSGRLLYYMEEPVMRFGPLALKRRDADFDDVMTFLESQPAAAYREMVVHALTRVHQDLATGVVPRGSADRADWRRFLAPTLTTATMEDALGLVDDPNELKRRTIALFRGVWEDVYASEYARRLPVLREAARLATNAERREFVATFAELTGNRLPAALASGLNEVECVTFCPSYHLSTFVSYIVYPPDAVIFFGAPEFVARAVKTTGPQAVAPRLDGVVSGTLADGRTLDAFRALADSNRLRILDLLRDDELYAQEIVGRLGIAQSAVSRHLSILERANLVTVRPRRGMKYYALARDRIDVLADALRTGGSL